MFSAILDPAANLVKGVILVMVVTVIAKLATRLFALKSKVMECVYKRLDSLLHDKVAQFMLRNPGVAAQVADKADEHDSKELPMDEIFAILDENSSNNLCFDEEEALGMHMHICAYVCHYVHMHIYIYIDNLF